MIYFFEDQLTDMASDTDLVKELNYKLLAEIINCVGWKLLFMSQENWQGWEGEQMCLWSKQ